MIQKTLSMGKRPVYYVQKSYRNEDGKPSPSTWRASALLRTCRSASGEKIQSVTTTIKHLEEKLKEKFGLSKVVVCTDGGLSSYDNRKHDSVGERSFITFRPASEPTPR